MENQELKFKTNLNCSGCVSKVQTDLDQSSGISAWKVDTENPDKILTVQSTGITKDQVIDLIKSKGFQAEELAK